MSVTSFDEIHVISDLHFGGRDPENKGNFQIFNQGDRLANFIKQLAQPRVQDGGTSSTVALILNGDIVDFLAEDKAMYLDTDTPIDKLKRIREDQSFSMVWDAMQTFVAQAHCHLVIVLGNHDVELALPQVKEWMLDELTEQQQDRRYRITYATDGAGYRCNVGDKKVLCVHGNEADGWNVVDYFQLLQTSRAINRGMQPKAWEANAGTQMVVDVMNEVKRKFPMVDLLKPETQAVVPTIAALSPESLTKLGKLTGLYRQQGRDQKRIDEGLLGDNGDEQHSNNQTSQSIQDFEREITQQLGLNQHQGNDSVEDLLLGAYSNVEKGHAPVDTTDNELLGIGDYFSSLRNLITGNRVEALRNALLGLTEGDQSFELDGPDDILDNLDDKVGRDIDYLIAGHTHLARVKPRQHSGTWYYNSGTWIRLIELSRHSLEDKDEFARIYDAFATPNMAALDKLNDLGPDKNQSLIKPDTSFAVSVLKDGSSARAQLSLVAEDGNWSVVENTQR